MTTTASRFITERKIARAGVSPVVGASAAFILSLAFFGAGTDSASALPSFARQTGQPCAACHTAFPQLTPFGRRFKLGGYTLEGGDPGNIPPVAFMLQSTFTHYNGALNAASGAYAPPGSPNGGFPDRNNITDLSQQVSIFYGGKVFGNVGAFTQWTFANDYGRAFGMDNSDIRYADSTNIAGHDVLYGLDANNNPTVQDVWNTTPAWSSPFISSNFSLSPVAGTMIESFAPGQQLGGGAYVFVDDTYYAELAAYGSTSQRMANILGVGYPSFTIDGPAPYWRFAAEKLFGDNSLEIGTYGMAANIIPTGQYGFGTDKMLDLGFDSQYQWITEKHAITLRANYIFEQQNLDNSYQYGSAANPTDYLRTLKLSAEYVYDHTYSFTGTYFQITGSPDAAIFGNNVNTSPNSAGFILDAAYLPFSHGSPWPYSTWNTRLGVSYTAFTQFDGGSSNIDPVGCPNCGRRASDNNTLLLYAFTAF